MTDYSLGIAYGTPKNGKIWNKWEQMINKLGKR